jgi:hypothetical protein
MESRRNSVASGPDVAIDFSASLASFKELDGVSTPTNDGYENDNLTLHLDKINDIVKTIYNNKTQTKKAQFEEIHNHINKLKNKIINFLLPLAKAPPAERPVQSIVTQESPTYAEMLKSNTRRMKPKAATVIVKTGSESKPEFKTVMNIEKSVASILNDNNINATLQAVNPGRNGSVIMKFDEKDDVSEIAKNIEKKLNMKAYGRKLFIPKMKISHIPEYISIDSVELKTLILKSNKWLNDLLQSGGETFEIVFAYKVKDFGSAVCRLSPQVRHHILQEGKRIKIGMRTCPVSDRIHVQRCGKCQKYGHKTQTCFSDHHICAWCSDEHMTMQCPRKKDQSAHSCINCKRHNQENQFHPSHSSKCCVLQRERERIASNTDWGDDPPCFQ